MPKRLYEVVWSGRCFVMAINPTEACSVAEEAAGDSLGAGLESYAQVTDTAPNDWLDGIPYGSDDERTVRQILAERKTSGGEP